MGRTLMMCWQGCLVAAVPLLAVSCIRPSAAQRQEVTRAEGLLAEFRAAKPYRHGGERPQDDRAGRDRLQIARDMLKLDRVAVPTLLEALDDPDPEVSAAVAFALAAIGDSRSAEPMLRILKSFLHVPAAIPGDRSQVPPGNLRAVACACALGQLREPRAVEPIMAVKGLPVPYSQLVKKLWEGDFGGDYMCGVMWFVGDSAIRKMNIAAAPELVRLLYDGDARIRASAARHLGDLGIRDRNAKMRQLAAAPESPELLREREAFAKRMDICNRVAALAGERLIGLLHDEDIQVRRNAAQALGLLHVAAAVGPLVERVKEAHRRTGYDRNSPGPLVEIYYAEHSWVGMDAAEALGEIGDPAALDALAAAIGDHVDQGSSAERAVGMIGGPKALGILRSALNGYYSGNAMAGLSALGTPEARALQVEFVNKVLDNAPRDSCVWAARWLLETEGPQGPNVGRTVEPLIALARDEAPRARCQALELLGRIADPRGAGAVMAALKDKESSVRAAAIEALGRIEGPKSFGPVKEMLKDGNAWVRYQAVRALRNLNPPDLSECLRPMLKDKDEFVRREAKSALDALAKPAAGQTEKRRRSQE